MMLIQEAIQGGAMSDTQQRRHLGRIGQFMNWIFITFPCLP